MRSIVINYLIMGLLLIPGCSTKDKSSSKKSKALNVNEIKLNAGDYNAIEDSSEVLWECKWLGGARHDGSVQLVSGSINISETSEVNGRFIVDLNLMKCFDLTNEGANRTLIRHLKSDDFFDVANYPEAMLDLISGKNISGNQFEFSGKLTIKGRSHPITFTGTVIENNLSYDTNLRLIFDRSKYDVRYRSASLFSDLGDRIIADDVKLTVKAKFKKVSKI